jgi:hypothetical protein
MGSCSRQTGRIRPTSGQEAQQFSFCPVGGFGLRQFDSVFGHFLNGAGMIQAARGDLGQIDSRAARELRSFAG